jgi:hypothetical protein
MLQSRKKAMTGGAQYADFLLFVAIYCTEYYFATRQK